MRCAAAVAIALVAGAVLMCTAGVEDAEAMWRKAVMKDYRVYAPVIPDTLTFAGERVPLETYFISNGPTAISPSSNPS